MVAATALALAPALVLLGAAGVVMEGVRNYRVWTLFGVGVAFSVLPIFLRRTGRINLTVNVLCAACVGLLALFAHDSGGQPVAAMVWFTVLPVAAYFYAGPRTAIGWAIALALLAFIYVGMSIAGYPFPNALTAAQSRVMGAVSAALALTVAVIIGGVYEMERRRAVARLRGLVADLELARDEAHAAVHAKSEFLAMMSHEIRTPLNAVIGMTGLLMDSGLSSKQREMARTVRVSGNQLLTLINDVLDFSKIEAGELRFEQTEFDVAAAVEDAVELFAAPARARGLALASFIAENVPERVVGDPARIRQILLNLLSNAVKFTRQGHIVARAGLISSDGGEVVLRFEVEDTGPGLSKEHSERLFEPFTQADSSTTRRHGGTGLGLAICRRLVELMGGEIRADAEVGRGCTLRFTVRVAYSDEGQTLAARYARLFEKTVLVVSARRTDRDAVAHVMRVARVNVWIASDASEAEALLKAAVNRGEAVDLMVVDRRLPDGNPEVVVPRLRAVLAAPCLVLGSAVTEEIRNIDGVYAALSRPARRHTLLQAVSHALGITRPERPPTHLSMPTVVDARVLVVEDNPVNQTVAQMCIEKLGYRVDVVANGIEALDALARIPYDAVLMDCQMPEMDGYEATRELRRREAGEARHTPIIAMTASVLQADRERCQRAGMDDFVSKPVDLDALDDLLTRWIARPDKPGSGVRVRVEPD